MAYGLEIRTKVVSFIQRGHSPYQASITFNIGKSTIYRWLQREDLAPKLNYPKHQKINKDQLRIFVKNNPDAYLREIAQEFNVQISSVHNALKNMGYTNKKNTNLQRSKRRVTRKISEDI